MYFYTISTCACARARVRVAHTSRLCDCGRITPSNRRPFTLLMLRVAKFPLLFPPPPSRFVFCSSLSLSSLPYPSFFLPSSFRSNSQPAVIPPALISAWLKIDSVTAIGDILKCSSREHARARERMRERANVCKKERNRRTNVKRERTI